MNLTGQFETCTGCARGKARQANTNKVSDKQAEHPGERLFVDLTGPFQESLTKNRYMAMAVDQKTSRIFHFFQKTKNQLEKNIAGLLDELEAKGFPVKFIRMDNGGENKALIELCRMKGNCSGSNTASHTTVQWSHRTEVRGNQELLDIMHVSCRTRG